MGKFFKPWRRKFDVLTLVIACLFMAGWVRSLTTDDVISFHSSKRTAEHLQSVNCVIVWTRSCSGAQHHERIFPKWSTGKFHADTKWFDETEMVYLRQFLGFAFGKYQNEDVQDIDING